MSQEQAPKQNADWAPVIAKITFLLLTIVLLGTVVFLVRKVLHAIILGMLCAGAFMPVHNWIHRKIAGEFPRLRLLTFYFFLPFFPAFFFLPDWFFGLVVPLLDFFGSSFWVICTFTL